MCPLFVRLCHLRLPHFFSYYWTDLHFPLLKDKTCLWDDAKKTNACQSQVCVADRRLTVNMKMKVTKKKERSFQAIHLKNKFLATQYRFHH